MSNPQVKKLDAKPIVLDPNRIDELADKIKAIAGDYSTHELVAAIALISYLDGCKDTEDGPFGNL
jgi:hypothetical protein